jgi:polyhydroxyalkanoate synthesis repressor PhaR
MSPTSQTNGGASSTEKPPVVVKKYANRRLYNTESSSYITLDTLADMVRVGRDFVVYDAKTGDDITRSVLTQIIVEEENKGRNLLPTGFLRQLIGFYGDSVQTMVPRYLEQALTTFARQQEQVREAMKHTMGNFFPFGIDEVSRQNMAVIERAMSLFTPFYQPPDGSEPRPAENVLEELSALRDEVDSLRRQLAEAQQLQVPGVAPATPTETNPTKPAPTKTS